MRLVYCVLIKSRVMNTETRLGRFTLEPDVDLSVVTVSSAVAMAVVGVVVVCGMFVVSPSLR